MLFARFFFDSSNQAFCYAKTKVEPEIGCPPCLVQQKLYFLDGLERKEVIFTTFCASVWSSPKITIPMWCWLLNHRLLNSLFSFYFAIPENSIHTLPSSLCALTFQEIPKILSLTPCVFPVQTEGISQESLEQKHKQTPVPWLGLPTGMPNTSPCSLSLIPPSPWVTAGGHCF